jgi:hypothetical protein
VLCRLAQECLDPCEGVLDGVEVGTAGREAVELSACRLYELANPWPLVAREIVHDDDVAGAQLLGEDLFDIGLEGVTVVGAVENEGRDETAQGQRTDEGCRFPMAMVHSNPEPPASRAAAMATRHVGGSPGLADEHEALWRQMGLPPRTSPCGASECRDGPARRHGLSFFARDGVTREESLSGSAVKGDAWPGQRMTQLLDGSVLGRTKRRQNGIMVRFDAA